MRKAFLVVVALTVGTLGFSSVASAHGIGKKHHEPRYWVAR